MRYILEEKHLIAMVEKRKLEKAQAWNVIVELLIEAGIKEPKRRKIITKIWTWTKCRDRLRDSARALQVKKL